MSPGVEEPQATVLIAFGEKRAGGGRTTGGNRKRPTGTPGVSLLTATFV